jgi:hypothetical protein
MEGDCGIGGCGDRLWWSSVECRLIHSKARQWMASAQTAVARQAASGPALRSTNPLHSRTPRLEWRYGRRRQVSWLTGHRRHHLPGLNPVAFGAGFPLTVAGAAPASPETRELPQISRARYSLLVPPEDETPSAGDSFRRKRRRVNPSGTSQAAFAGCPGGSDMILSRPSDQPAGKP